MRSMRFFTSTRNDILNDVTSSSLRTELQLPPEIITHVLSFLDYVNLNKSRLVNKTWNQLIKDLLLQPSANKYIVNELNRCDLVQLIALPLNCTLINVPIEANAAYVRYADQLFYINKINNVILHFRSPNQINFLNQFDNALQPNTEARTLSENELTAITLLTGHHHGETPEKKLYSKEIKQHILLHPEEAPRVARQFHYLKSAKNRLFHEEKEIKPDTFRCTKKGLGYSTLFLAGPLGMLASFSFLLSRETGKSFIETYIDCIQKATYELACGDRMKYKEYTCDPSFMIPLLVVASLSYLAFCYLVGKSAAREHYRCDPHYPYQSLIPKKQ